MKGSTATASVTDTKALSQPGWIGRQRSRWRTSRKSYIVSATFLALVLVAGLWILIVPPPAPAPTPDAGDSAQAGAAGGAQDVMPSPAVICGAQPALPLTSEQVAATTYVTTWYPVGMMSAPSSPEAGPTQARRCFARTPEGALYAAVTRMAEEAAATGVTQEAASKGISDIHFDGYQWLSWTPDRAVLMVRISATNSVETRHAARALDVTWADNDWAVVPDDTSAAASAAADPKRVFTPWGNN